MAQRRPTPRSAAHTELGPFLALATALTVFVIALAYSQVLEIFPSGGGSYKIASQLLGPRFGLVSGSAQVVDYVLTIAVSLASGADALFSLLPLSAQAYKLPAEIGLTLLLVVLNLRGTQESIRFLAPVVVGFLLVHAGLILFGLGSDAGRVVGVWGNAGAGVLGLSEHSGWVFVAAIFVRAFALGGSTYTGVESISNHVNLLAEPRVKTGRMTMLYVALSLSFTAGGIVLLYALEAVQPAHGQTLNAIVFNAIIGKLGLDGAASQGLLILTLALEGAILLVAANSILIFAPSLLGNMASDSWLPHRFRDLSSRLVREDGVIFIGACTVGDSAVDTRRARCAGGLLQHQRVPVPDVFEARALPLLVGPAPGTQAHAFGGPPDDRRRRGSWSHWWSSSPRCERNSSKAAGPRICLTAAGGAGVPSDTTALRLGQSSPREAR